MWRLAIIAICLMALAGCDPVVLPAPSRPAALARPTTRSTTRPAPEAPLRDVSASLPPDAGQIPPDDEDEPGIVSDIPWLDFGIGIAGTVGFPVAVLLGLRWRRKWKKAQ